jgi:hypothetical protein
MDSMNFGFDTRTENLRARLLEFMREEIFPAEPIAEEQMAAATDPWDRPPARWLRLADGPDEVHRMALARHELAPYRAEHR